MATGWTRSLAIEKSWFFVTISAFKLDISLFMAAICALSSSVFLSFLLIHYGCLFCLNKLMKFTYNVIFYVAFGTFRWVSLFTGVHCVICVFKKWENYIVSHINVFNLRVVNFFCFSSHFKIFCNFYNLSLNFCFILYDFVTFIWGRCIVVRSGSIWIVMFIGHIYHICKCAGGACFRDPGPAGKSDPGGL